MRKISALFATIILMLLFAFSAGAEYDDVYEYTVKSGQATITAYCGYGEDAVEIPDTLGGYPVAVIGNQAFYCADIKSLTIPDTVMTIGEGAFYWCSLENVTIGDSVTDIGAQAFYYCRNLKSINIPDSVKTIGDEAFYECYALENVTVGDRLTVIGDGAFYYCNNLKSITIPDSVKTIGDKAFCGCYSIKSVDIPDNVTSLGNSAFDYCSSLTDVTIGNRITAIGACTFADCYSLTSIVIPDSVKTIGDDAFRNCYALRSVTIGKSVTEIGNEAFYNCNSIKSITIPDSVTAIGDSAFSYCSTLTSIDIPDSVKTIGDKAFYACYNLDSVTIGKGVTSIGKRAFDSGRVTVHTDNSAYSNDEYGALFNKDKTVLIGYPSGNRAEVYNVPGTVVTVSDYAFSNSGFYLKEIILPDSVTTIGDFAFESSNIKKITLGKGVEKISGKAFSYLVDITIDEENEHIVLVDNVIYNKEKTELLLFNSEKNTFSEEYVDFDIPYGVEKIADNAFYDCRTLKYLTIPDSVKIIGDGAFDNCYNLSGVSFGNGVTTIGNHAFADCQIKEIALPDSVKTIGESAFYYNSELESITIPEGVTSIGKEAFDMCNALNSIIIPDSVTAIGADALPWQTVIYCNRDSYAYSYAVDNNRAFILIDGTDEDNVISGVTENITWTLYKDTGVLIISGTGDMPPRYYEGYPWEKYSPLVSSVVITEGVTSIGMSAFYNFTKLRTASISSDVIRIENNAFQNCDSLKSIKIPDGVEAIEGWAFNDCDSLKSIEISKSVTFIGEDAFKDCDVLEGVTVDEENPVFFADEYGALYNRQEKTMLLAPCSKGLTEYTIPEGIENICEEAFSGQGDLKSITIPASVKEIGENAFDSCRNLRKVYISDIAAWCAIDFKTETSNPLPYGEIDDMSLLYLNNEPVTELVIPDGVTSVSDYAFVQYFALKSVKIPASVTSIGTKAFLHCLLLGEIEVDENNQYYSNDEHGALFNKDKTVLIRYPSDGELYLKMNGFDPETPQEEYELYTELYTSFKKYKVPDTVTAIADYAFVFSYFLTGITLPDSLTDIGKNAFEGVENLWYLRVPGGIDSVGELFNEEDEYDSLRVDFLEIGEGVKKIDITIDGTSIMIPSTVTEISAGAFDEYNNIEDIFYAGTQEQWNSMVSASDREALKNTNVHFNCCKGDHEYTNEIEEEVYMGDLFLGYDKYICEKCGWWYGDIKAEIRDHRIIGWQVIEPATCTKEGTEARGCEGYEYCGYYETRPIPKKSHSYTSSVTRPATHLSEGIRTYTCECGNTYDEIISKTAEHSYSVASVVKPSCESGGYTTYICECGHSYNGDNKPATGHNYSGNSCTVCGETKTDNCSCNCHKGGFMSFIWKILSFFYKLFGMNKTCACGVAHY